MADRIIFVFPGQGAQYVGMAKDLFENFAVVRHTFECVSDLAHRDMRRICFNGSQSELNLPENTSLATFTHSVSIAHVLEHEFERPIYSLTDAVVGHSMGQYPALYCAGGINFDDAVTLLSARSSYMTLASSSGGMIAIVGLQQYEIEHLLALSVDYGYAEIANYNADDQFVISGQDAALRFIQEQAIVCGARIAKRLNISVPAHSALMASAGVLLDEKLKKIDIRSPQTNWFSNQTACVMNKSDDIRGSLVNQMTHGVRWVQIMHKFPEYKITRAYELGPGRVLTRLINRANVGVRATETDNVPNVRAMIAQLSQNMR